MSKQINISLLQLIVAILSSGAISGFGAAATMHEKQIINQERIQQNTKSIVETRKELKESINKLQEITLQLTQIATRLEK